MYRDDEIVKSLDDVYQVGTFTQIREIQDLGDKIRMVILGHRRITINGVATDDMISSSPSVIDQAAKSVDDKGKNGFRRRMKRVTVIEPSQSNANTTTESSEVKTESEQQPVTNQILMVDTSNLQHHSFTQTQEIKALTNEIVKTIRDLISLNPIMRETISLLLQNGQRVAENPVYLSDLGAAITNADPKEQQEVLEELDVINIIA